MQPFPWEITKISGGDAVLRNVGETMKLIIVVMSTVITATAIFGSAKVVKSLQDAGMDFSDFHTLGLMALFALGTVALTTVILMRLGRSQLDAIEFVFVFGAAITLAGGYWAACLLTAIQPNVLLLACRAALAIFCTVLPSALFYLFLSGNRNSVLVQYLVNLRIMGMLKPRPDEPHEVHAQRIGRYIDRLEAAYGPVLSQHRDNIVHSARRNDLPALGQDYFGVSLRLLLPVAWVSALCALGWYLALPPVAEADGSITPVSSPLVYSFLGAYWLSLQTLIWRFFRRDLLPVAYVEVAKRIILGVIAAWVVTTFLASLPDSPLAAGHGTTLLVAFGIGAFPAMAWDFVSNAFKRLPGIDVTVPSMREPLPVGQIDGLNQLHEIRLEEEDVTNVHGLANASIIDLLANTRFATPRLIDWIDQAVLLTTIACDSAEETTRLRAILRAYGIRTATALARFLDSERPSPTIMTETVTIAGQTMILHDWMRGLYAAVDQMYNFHLVSQWKKNIVSAHDEHGPARNA
jgi:hypothetical protein